MSMPDYAAKIAALLTKAERTTNPHEAEAYQAKAEALMLKWGIDHAVAYEAARRTEGRKACIAEMNPRTVTGRGPEYFGNDRGWQAGRSADLGEGRLDGRRALSGGA